jgi:hypothetical protein
MRAAGVRTRRGPRDVQERRGLDLFDLCRKPRDSPLPVSICLSRVALLIADQTTRQPRLCQADQRAPIYNLSMRESASEADLSEDDPAIPNFRAKFPCFAPKMGLAHFRWKTSTDFRRKREKTPEQPIHPPNVRKSRFRGSCSLWVEKLRSKKQDEAKIGSPCVPFISS